MGNLITELPVSEMNATIELLDRLGVDREGLKRFRKASSHEQFTVAAMIQNGIVAAPETPKFVPAPAQPTRYEIDLSSPAKLPFNGAVLEVHRGKGVVVLEKRGDNLFVDGHKIELHFSENQKGGKVIVGHKLRKELEKRGRNAAAKILDCLVEHPELWPESWKKDAQGNTIYVFFWDDIFRNPSGGGLYVRCGYWDGGRVVSGCRWLGGGWRGSNPCASLASTSDFAPVA